ncbi:MAG: ABC transporter ATP-binding protein [Novosphingobium sp.]
MSAQPVIVEGLSHSVLDSGHEKRTLAPLSRDFAPGKLHVINGPSGSGKTTLLSLLALSVAPSRGLIHWGKLNLTQLKAAQAAAWRKANLGLIFQTSRLVSVMTAIENACFGGRIRGLQIESEAAQLLAGFGLGGRKDHLPSQLSGGEKQRVAIAQALACRPALLLADEPTASLDSTNAAFVAQTLKAYAVANAACVICVSHDSTVIEAADELLTLTRP